METKKVLGLIFSLLFIGAFAFVLSWGIINFNKVKDGMSGTGLYTQEDINKSYEDGYNTALQDKNEYEQLINSYRDTITNQTDQISQLNSQVVTLTNNNKDYANQIRNLESQKSNLQSQVDNLTTIKTNNEITIASLQSQVATLQNEVETLTNSGEDKDELITQKNNQIASLQTTVSQLQRTNELNVETITNLNNQIASLNNQISDMSLQIQNNSANVTSLNNKIAELEKSVAYYEQYIANLENETQVVVTFEFNGSVYNIQIVNKNSTVSVVDPTSTDYVVFNYWTVDGQQIDLLTYQFATNTKVVADVTYKYDVKFIVDDSVYNSQIVIKNDYATIPTNPTKNGYEFDGWSINGVDVVNPNTTAITQNTTYVAKFTKLHTVTFMYEDTVYSTQTIRNNEYSSNVVVDNTTYKIFNGWKLNGVIVDLSNTKIVADTTFVADITYKYDVKFMVDDSVYNSQIVIKNGYATIPTNPAKPGHEFAGWSFNGIDVVDIETLPVTSNINYTAIFTKSIVSLTAQNYLNYVYKIGENNITNIVFDYYTSNNEYIVDGVNVINGLSGNSLDSDNKISLYQKDSSLYILSNYSIQIDTGLRLFYNNRSLTSIFLNNFDTSNVTNMNKMFYNCSSLTTLDLSNFNTSNVTNMSFMFETCQSLTTLDLSNFDTRSVTNMSYMFTGCRALTFVNLSSFDTSNVEYMMGMFDGCSNLTTLDLSTFNTAKVRRFEVMFRSCSALTTIYANENFVTTSVEVDEVNYIDGRKWMFLQCEKLVGAISYDSKKTDCSYANYSNGYFTYKAKA